MPMNIFSPAGQALGLAAKYPDCGDALADADRTRHGGAAQEALLQHAAAPVARAWRFGRVGLAVRLRDERLERNRITAMTGPTGNKTHDATVLSAESTRQAAVNVAGVSQATATPPRSPSIELCSRARSPTAWIGAVNLRDPKSRQHGLGKGNHP